jgi:hypothetical protein
MSALACRLAFVLAPLVLSAPVALAHSTVHLLPELGRADMSLRLLAAPPAAATSSLSPDWAVTAGAAAAPAGEADLPWYHTGYAWRGPVAAAPDWPGVRRDTVYFLGYQVFIVGAVYLMPTSVSKWDKSEANNALERWRENVSNPVWDSDDTFVNYVLHPYWGATYYVRGRERGLDKGQSFLFSVTLSTLFEYTLEAVFEPVSLNDLIVTPIVGSLIGEFLFTPLRDHIRAKPGELGWGDKTLLVLTDPLGVVSAWTDRTFGVASSVSVRPIGAASTGFRRSDALVGTSAAGAAGALIPANRQPWGLHVKMVW